MPFPF